MTGKDKKQALRSVQFRKEREKHWRQLEGMVECSLKRGPSCLSTRELILLPQLYREALASLSVARATAMDRALVNYLESLAARAWLAVYGSRASTRWTIGNFVRRTFPATVRDFRWQLGLATLLFALGLVVGWALVTIDPEWYYAFVNPVMASGRDPWASAETLRESLYSSGGNLADFSAYLFVHNSSVGMLAFGLGIAAGIPAGFLLFYNGLLLGAFCAVFAEKGLLLPLLGWILPHGVPEITAILLCGAAGMALGQAMLFPGDLPRREALSQMGRKASLLVAGAVLMLSYAGILEGVFRQSVQNDQVRFLLVAFNITVLTAWFFLAGRDRVAGRDLR